MNQKVIIRRPGGLDQLELTETPDPVPGKGEALIRVLAAGAAFGDVLLRRGLAGGRFPVTPGYDLVGIVEALGSGTSRVCVGDLVASLPGAGEQQELICLAESVLVTVPQGIGPEKAAAVILNYITALQLLTRVASLKVGQTAFVYGLAGGLGSALQQVASQLGIRLFGTARGERVAAARRSGAIAFDRDDAGWVAVALAAQPGGFDAVFDPIGGHSLSRSYGLLAPKGTLAMLGVAAAVQGSGNPRTKMLATLARFLGLKLRFGGRCVRLYVTRSAKHDPGKFRNDLSVLFGWLGEGKIEPAIHAVLPLGDVRRAQEMLERSEVVGKIVLNP